MQNGIATGAGILLVTNVTKDETLVNLPFFQDCWVARNVEIRKLMTFENGRGNIRACLVSTHTEKLLVILVIQYTV